MEIFGHTVVFSSKYITVKLIVILTVCTRIASSIAAAATLDQQIALLPSTAAFKTIPPPPSYRKGIQMDAGAKLTAQGKGGEHTQYCLETVYIVGVVLIYRHLHITLIYLH